MKYIDADKLKAEIERLDKHYLVREYDDGWNNALNAISKFLDTIPEQPTNDFCKENCKGYQETGKCFSDGPCAAKQEASKEQPVRDHHKIEVKFRGEKVTISREFYRNGEMNYSTSEQDDNAIWFALRAWCEKKGITPFELYPKQSEQPVEWEDEYREEDLRTRFAFYTYKNEEDDGVLYLSNVFVEETSRNKGFGTKILFAAEKVAETIGATTIRLKVTSDSPANVWYRKNGYGYMTSEDGYDWLEKNLEYMKPNRQEWSEEDEEMRNLIITIFEVNHPDGFFKANELGTTDMRGVHTEEIISWLKSLRLRSRWKSSKEQIGLLGKVYNLIWADPATPADVQDGLGDFIEQLKTL